MTSTNRLIINTLAQNIRSVVNILMSLYSTRLVLEALGESDYGIYMLVGGIVSMLSYLSNAMVATTQRHISFSYGEEDDIKVRTIFHNSCILHWGMSILTAFLFVSVTSLLFDTHFLNIDIERLQEAKYVYWLVISSVFFTFIASPYRALLIARENIVYISIIDVLDGVLKLSLVFILFYIDEYRLTAYACIMSSIMLFNYVAVMGYSKWHYQEACVIPQFSLLSKQIQKRLIGFATWTLYQMLCIYFRAQGIAVVLNRIYGTVVNTSFGIANQVFNSMAFVSAAILNAITPQIVKAEGAGNRQRMIYLSHKACKYAYLFLAMLAFPLMFEIENVLALWLGTIPPYAIVLCVMLLVATLCDQLTIGYHASIQALGNIRNYSLLLYTVKVLTIPFFWLCLKLGYSIEYAILVMILFEAISAVLRLAYAFQKIGVRKADYMHSVIFPLLLPTLIMLAMGYLMTQIPLFSGRFLLTGVVCVLSGGAAMWLWGTDQRERTYINQLIRQKLKIKSGK